MAQFQEAKQGPYRLSCNRKTINPARHQSLMKLEGCKPLRNHAPPVLTPMDHLVIYYNIA